MEHSYNPVGWFEIPVSDMTRAKEFYEKLLGVEISVRAFGELDMGWFPMNNMEAKGATGALVKHAEYKPSPDGVLIYFTAPELEATLAKAEELGGKLLQGKKQIGEYGFMGLILDSEGNRIALHSRT